MADVVPIQVCQPGFDVRNCPDWAYLFNSQWPNLAIAWEKTVTPGAPATYNHNLGFIPLTVVTNGVTGPKRSYGRVPTGFSVTANTITIFGGGAIGTYTIRCFNVDVTKEKTYPLPQAAAAKFPYNDQFGIKVAKDKRFIYSKNLNDFVIHSRGQSQAVSQVATQNGPYYTNTNPGSDYPGPWIVYPLKTSYIPWAYSMRVTSTSPLTYDFLGVGSIQVINNQLVLATNGAAGASLVVLRDPLFYPNVVRVVY